jgi:hypothetical protein
LKKTKLGFLFIGLFLVIKPVLAQDTIIVVRSQFPYELAVGAALPEGLNLKIKYGFSFISYTGKRFF